MKIVFICFIFIALFSVSCSPAKIFLVNSEGILTYDRKTGNLEVLWNTKAKAGEAVTDTTKLDSVLTIR